MAREVWVVEDANGEPQWATACAPLTEASLRPGQRVIRYVPAADDPVAPGGPVKSKRDLLREDPFK